MEAQYSEQLRPRKNSASCTRNNEKTPWRLCTGSWKGSLIKRIMKVSSTFLVSNSNVFLYVILMFPCK